MRRTTRPKTSAPAETREAEVRAVLEVLAGWDHATTAEIVAETSLQPAAVRVCLADLIDAGVARAEGGLTAVEQAAPAPRPRASTRSGAGTARRCAVAGSAPRAGAGERCRVSGGPALRGNCSAGQPGLASRCPSTPAISRSESSSPPEPARG